MRKLQLGEIILKMRKLQLGEERNVPGCQWGNIPGCQWEDEARTKGISHQKHTFWLKNGRTDLLNTAIKALGNVAASCHCKCSHRGWATTCPISAYGTLQTARLDSHIWGPSHSSNRLTPIIKNNPLLLVWNKKQSCQSDGKMSSSDKKKIHLGRASYKLIHSKN